MFKFKPTQKLHIIVNGVSIFTNARDVRIGIGDSTKINIATGKALFALEEIRGGLGNLTGCSVSGGWNGISIQINVKE